MDDPNNPNPAPGQAPPQPVVTPPAPTVLAPPQSFEQPAAPQPAPPTGPAAITTPLPAGMPPAPKKQSLLWLWITVGIIVLLGIIIGLVLFVSKQSADTAARDYTTASTAYIKKIHDAVERSGTIADAKDSLEESTKDKPLLKEVFLSGVSSDYTKAKTLQTTVDKKVKDFSTGISELASVDAYIADNNEKYTEISSAARVANAATTRASAIAAMNDVLTIIQEVQKTTNDTVFPSELAETKKDLVAAYNGEVDGWKAMIAALEQNDSTAYEAAYDQFEAAADKETEAGVTLNQYSYDIPAKQQSLLEKLDSSNTATT